MKSYIKSITMIITMTILGLILQGCNGKMNKQGGGTLIGGLAGGLIGSQFGGGEGKLLATGVGAVAGALIGGHFGKNMDEYDRQLAEKSSREALEFAPAGRSVAWRNPDSGNYGSITPTKTVKTEEGYCREYIQEIIVGGEKQKAYGKACRKPDGSWKIVK